jgi:hypothetical protein
VDVSEANNPYISNENKKNKGSQMGKKNQKVFKSQKCGFKQIY